jgi:signal transduction histidine kinase
VDVQDEVRTLSQTIESLLTLARAEAGLPTGAIAEVSFNEVVMEAVSRCGNLAAQREVRLVPRLAVPEDDRPGPSVAGDGALLTVMFANLIRNAVRFSPPNEPVDVTVRQDGGKTSVSIADRGPGIPPEYIERVFDRFFRVPDPTASFQGVGLGLTIARGIARLHGGDVRAANRAAGGCEFIADLPANSAPASAAH